jgi:CheY-like chemotaxis protein
LARQANLDEWPIIGTEVGNFGMENVSFSLNDVLDDVARQIGSAAGGRGVEKLFAVAEGVPRNLTGHPSSLRLVLAELFGIVLEGTASGEPVAGIDVVGWGSGLVRRSATLRFTVRNSGAGLTCEEAASILMKFFSSGPSTHSGTEADGRTGGREEVDRMGASIAVASEPRKGFAVSFTAEFGMRPDAADERKKRDYLARQRKSKTEIKMPEGLEKIRGARILLAEDNPVNQNLTKEILVHVGCDVDVAEDGQATVNAIRDGGNSYDVILMDVQMPIMDGFEAARRIRTDLLETDLPIIAITAKLLGDERQRCLAAGMDDYVPKPIHIPELYAALIRWIKPGKRNAGQTGETLPATKQDATPPSGTDVYLPDEIPEIDIESGLARAMGNRELYTELLIQFSKTNETVGADIGAAIVNGDLDRARFLVHGMASTAGNLGAEDLYATASELEKAFVAGRDSIGNLFGTFQDRLDKALNAIRTSGISEQGRQVRLGSGEVPLDRQEASRFAEMFTVMLEDQNMGAPDQVGKLLDIFGGRGHDEQLKRLQASLEALEFQDAREILAGICKEILA